MSMLSPLARCVCRTARTVAEPTARSALSQPSARRAMSMLPRRAGASTSWTSTSSSSRVRSRSAALDAGRRQQCRTFFVQTETTPNEDSLKFIPGMALSETGQTHEFLSSQDARTSPLASALFDIAGVRLVFFGPDFLTVSKTEDTQWALIKPEIYATIIEHFSSGKALFFEGHQSGEGPEDTRILDTDSEIVAMVKELLDTRVRPAIQEDGGDIEYKGFNEDTGLVTVSLKGSCRGCDSSTVTLKNGIERMLMHYIPEVKGVEQVISAEEAVASDEFAKFEERLRRAGKTVQI